MKLCSFFVSERKVENLLPGMFDLKKFGAVYLLLAVVLVLFVLSRLFPNKTIFDFMGSGGSLTATPSAGLQTQTTVQNLTVVLDFGTEQKTYTGIAAANAYLALVEAAKQDQLEYSSEEYGYGIQVTKVGNFAASATHSWAYFVNDIAGDAAPDRKTLSANDRIEWKYIQLN